MEITVEILFFIIAFVSIALNPTAVPGNFIAVGLLLLHHFLFPGGVSWLMIISGLFFALLGEGVESLMGMMGAKKYGATRWGMAAAFVGGLLGTVIGTALIPVIGTLVGVFAGGFIMTFLVEAFFVKKGVRKGLKAGAGTLLGRVISTAFKYTMGFSLLLLLVRGFWR
ncbi:MAG TPA: DUF456 domain-containing protein [Firmicutes bacterium]|nr:DUF456 domain-containing protein [Bacillota bacterium]